MQEDNGYRIRHHVQLPGGREIEVVYLDSSSSREHVRGDMPVPPEPWSGDSPSSAQEEALHICSGCAGKLAYPLDWAEESPGRWRIAMRCPDCDLQREGIFGQRLVERLDDELDKATGALLSDLKRITFANMAEEIEHFSRALQLDLIGPSDF